MASLLPPSSVSEPCIQPHCLIQDVAAALDICEPNLRNACPSAENCLLHHCYLPYLWQIDMEGWRNLFNESEAIEAAYCDPNCNHFCTQVTAFKSDGSSFQIDVSIDFPSSCAQLSSREVNVSPPGGMFRRLRRLSTASYAEHASHALTEDASSARHWTHWRWYWWDGSAWKLFNQDGITPRQDVLEAKFLRKQEVYRFVVETGRQSSAGASAWPADMKSVFLLDLRHLILHEVDGPKKWQVKRRPIFVSQQDVMGAKFVVPPDVTPAPFAGHTPDDWFPLDPQQQCELIPINPESMQYHLIASEFHGSLKTSKCVTKDIFRLQNPYLWLKFQSKKTHMQMAYGGARDPREMQLFHGTSEDAVQGIFVRNFDWRLHGKHNTLYGQGAYFALDAAFSDRYAAAPSRDRLRWQFLARVLVGRTVKGNSAYRVPPLVDLSNPLGERYDSCVDKEENPKIYVVFDSDQCYPEYVISYKSIDST